PVNEMPSGLNLKLVGGRDKSGLIDATANWGALCATAIQFGARTPTAMNTASRAAHVATLAAEAWAENSRPRWRSNAIRSLSLPLTPDAINSPRSAQRSSNTRARVAA